MIRYAQKPWFNSSSVDAYNPKRAKNPPKIPDLNIEFQVGQLGMGNGVMGGMEMPNTSDCLIFVCLQQIAKMETTSRPVDGLKAVEDASQQLHDAFVAKLRDAKRSSRESEGAPPFADNPGTKSPKVILNWPRLILDIDSDAYFHKGHRNDMTWTYIVHRWAKYLHGTPLPDALADLGKNQLEKSE